MSDDAKMTIKDWILGFYGIGMIGFTALYYNSHGFWEAFGFGVIWPIAVVLRLSGY